VAQIPADQTLQPPDILGEELSQFCPRLRRHLHALVSEYALDENLQGLERRLARKAREHALDAGGDRSFDWVSRPEDTQEPLVPRPTSEIVVSQARDEPRVDANERDRHLWLFVLIAA
jgi:hypothetical protein